MSQSLLQSLQWMLTADGCRQVRSLLWQAVFAQAAEAAVMVTEADATVNFGRLPFCIITAPGVAWLLAPQIPEAPTQQQSRGRQGGRSRRGRWTAPPDDESLFYGVQLTNDRTAIAEFAATHGLHRWADGWEVIDPQQESTVLVTVLAALAQPGSVVQEWESHQRQLRDRCLLSVTSAIASAQELPDIVDLVLGDLCKLLQVDRAVIYQFQARLQSIRLWRQDNATGLPSSWDDPAWQMTSDCVTYEARSHPNVPSILYEGADRCFLQPHDPRLRSTQTDPWIVTDTTPPGQSQVALPILAPIGGEIGLWGFLVLQQCDRARLWSTSDLQLLEHIARSLGVAIRVAHLNAALQQQQQLLGQQIDNQTRTLQEALLAAQSATRAKSEFLAAISHELRTPLTCVIGLSATLLRWSFGQLNQKQRDYLQTIHDSGEHLLKLIEDLLEMSQVEAGRMLLKVGDFSITQLVQTAIQNERHRANQRGVELLVKTQIAPPDDRFTADYQRVLQILANLLANAIKFTPQGGQAIVRVWRERELLILQVEDTGIGIPEDRIPQLFEMFHQLDPSYDRTYEGLGLGLALTKQLVDLHKGWIEVDSAPGKGSTFTVGIPAQPLTAQERRTTAPDSWWPSGSVILIDTQEDRAIALCELLTAAGYQVVWMPDGAIALAQLDVLQPQVAIISLRLTGMDGWEVVDGLRQQLPHIKVMMLGDRALESPLLQVHPGLQADAILGDQFDPEQLLHDVNALARSAALGTQPNGVQPGIQSRSAPNSPNSNFN
jgi:two-component system sensor histidine kinase/response regulator